MIRRVLRGGSYADDSRFLRSAIRYWNQSERRDCYEGFRLIIRREP